MTLRLSAAPKSASKPFLALAAVLILALASAVFPKAASAQNLRQDQAGNQYGPGLEKMEALVAKKTVEFPGCPAMTMELSVSNPSGSGFARFDQAMALKQESDVEKAQSAFFNDDPGDCGPDAPSSVFYYDISFEAHSSGGGVISVVYRVSAHNPWAASPTYWYEALNVDAGTGRELTMDDLFLSPPGAAEGLKSLWPVIAQAWCGYNGEKAIPVFYGLPEGEDWCADPEGAPLPEALLGRPAPALLGNAFLTAGGLSLRLDGDNTWGHSFGASTLNFDKRALIGLGFDPALWGR
ncbi:MAG: hypothetical protein LBE49_04490 [Deltaproteobacteria bacterium]|jgi:hypothetical protein|nr:hypothetical protein [Deltaproteobacteria bacterium]